MKPVAELTPQQAYQRGYASGARQAKRKRANLATWAQRNALWQRALLAALPFAMEQRTWKRGEEPINSLESRVQLAANVADQVIAEAQHRGRV